MWKTNTIERLSARWFTNEGEITNGSATAKIFRETTVGTQYIQSDNTLQSPIHTFSLTHDAEFGWTMTQEVTTDMEGTTMQVIYEHSETPLLLSESHLVISNTSNGSTDTSGAVVGDC